MKKPFEFLLYKTNRLHFSVRVYCNRSQKTPQRVKNNSHATRLRLVSYFLFFTRYDAFCDLLQYIRMEKCYINCQCCWTNFCSCRFIVATLSLYALSKSSQITYKQNGWLVSWNRDQGPCLLRVYLNKGAFTRCDNKHATCDVPQNFDFNKKLKWTKTCRLCWHWTCRKWENKSAGVLYKACMLHA